MTNTRQRKSRLHLVALTTFTLLVACDGSDPNALPTRTEIERDPNAIESLADIPENVEAIFEQSLSPLVARSQIPHSTRERIHQLRLQAKYRRCLTEQLPGDSINTRLAYHKQTFSTRKNPRILTVTIIPLLPQGITHQQFFDVGEGCDSDDAINQSTDAETVTINYTAPWQDNHPPTWGKCEITLPYNLMFNQPVPLIGQPVPGS